MILSVLNRFLHWMVVGITSPILVLMILSKGVTLETAGFALALMSTFVVVFELPSGILSDRLGRKRVYLISLGLSMAALVVLWFAGSFWTVGAGFCLFGLARAFSSGSIESDFIDRHIEVHGSDTLHRLVTAMGVGETLGLALGALIGGILPDLWTAWFPGDNRYQGNLLLPMALVAILFALTLGTHSARKTVTHVPIGTFLKDSGSVIRANPTLVVLLIGTTLWGFSFSALELYWQPQLKTILASESDTWIYGVINSGYFLASLVGTLVAGFLVSKTRGREGLVLGILRILTGLGLVVLSFQSGLWGFSVLYLLIMGFNGLLNVPESTVMNAQIPEQRRATLLSLGSLLMQTGGIVASVGFSLVKVYTSISTIWVVAGVVFALSSILYFGLGKAKKTPDSSPSES